MVVAIIGLMTSVVVLTMPNEDDSLRDTVGNTERALIALERHSVMTGQVYGVRFRPDGFDALVLTDDGWVLDGELLKPTALDFNDFSLTHLAVSGADMDLATDPKPAPHGWFLPTGERSPFALTIGGNGKQATLTVPESGPIEVRYEG